MILYGTWDNGKENGNYRDYRGYIGIIRVYVGDIIGIMEKKMETTIIPLWGVSIIRNIVLSYVWWYPYPGGA